jgi:ribosomal protein S18 acetylase RimI-like enzyme
MEPIEIHPLTRLDRSRLRELMTGYVSLHRYAVCRQETDMQTILTLTLEALDPPHVTSYWDCLSEDDLQRYEGFLNKGFSLGAYLAGQWIGVALAEPEVWNRVLNVWELHVHPDYRRQGIGCRLVDELARRASAAGLRALAVETQNTNVNAIRFYRSAGFTLEGLDLSYYTNNDLAGGEVAIFMKRKLN